MAAPLIAVVKHEHAYLRIMELTLKGEGYETLILSSDGASAHEVITREQPAAVVVDTWLGDRDGGWGLLQLLRLDPATVSIPVVLASSDEPNAVRARFAEASETDKTVLLFKPFKAEQLLAAIETALDGHG